MSGRKKMHVERIALLCSLANISQSKLARDLGISKQALSNYVNGHNGFNDVVRRGICDYFGLPLSVFEDRVVRLKLVGDRLEVLNVKQDK